MGTLVSLRDNETARQSSVLVIIAILCIFVGNVFEPTTVFIDEESCIGCMQVRIMFRDLGVESGVRVSQPFTYEQPRFAVHCGCSGIFSHGREWSSSDVHPEKEPRSQDCGINLSRRLHALRIV